MVSIERMMQYLQKERKGSIYFTKQGCDFVNHFQEMITRERVVIRDEKKIIPPGMELQLINESSINAISTKIDEEYCIFVYKGIIEEQKEYLRCYEWNFFSSEEEKEQYLDDIIEYGFYFIAAHEYAHIFCGHLDVRLTEPNELIAEECEADMFSIDYLMKYIQFIHPIENITGEVEKLFLAVYFLFENMQRQNYQEFYNDKLMQNYYDPDRIQKRDHPLDVQRILYLYDMLNIVVITDEAKLLPIKKNIIEKLRHIKRIGNVEHSINDINYSIVEDSINKIRKSIKDIQEKKPRINA